MTDKTTLETWGVTEVNAQLVVEKVGFLKRIAALEKQADHFRNYIRDLRQLCDTYRRDKNKWQDIATTRNQP